MNEIKCNADCEDCQAHERGIFAVSDQDGKGYIVAAHDTVPTEHEDGSAFFGAWWQVFGEYPTFAEAQAHLTRSEDKVQA